MKLSFAFAALSVIPSVMGNGLDESCFLMPAAAQPRRRLEGENFYENPGANGVPTVEILGETVSCTNHQAIVDLGFVKLDANAVCTTTLGENSKQCEEENKQYQCENPLDGKCDFDIHWDCKDILDGEIVNIPPGTYVKAVFCGTTRPCKTGLAICALDPHFKTWADDDSWYDFHGQCDLKYMSDPDFFHGLGLEINIRTKGRYEYSYIESAAIKLGDDVFEFSSYGDIHYNGVASANVDGIKMADRFLIEHTKKDKKHQAYKIHIKEEEHIEVASFKDMVSVKLMNAKEYTFGKTVGMMGDFMEGKLTSRDGKKVYNIKDQEEINAFGQEWQVLASEPNLFQTPSDPTQKCVMPSKTASVDRQRRLGENAISEDVARAACATAKTEHMEMCIFDVMATADLDLAVAGVY